jgi:hypothetical protein
MPETVIQWPSINILNRVINEFTVDPSQFIGVNMLPVVVEYAPTVKWDILGGTLGMTKAYQIDSEPQAIPFRRLYTKQMDTMYWAELGQLSEADLLYIRQQGTLSDRAGRRLLASRLEQLNTRLETRMEWLRWQAMQGSLTVNEEQVNRMIDYEVPSNHKITLTGSALWTDTVNSNPISDFMNWALLYRGTGAGKPTAFMNKKTAQLLAKNATVRDLVKQSTNTLLLGPGTVDKLLLPLVSDLDGIVVYDGGYTDDSYTFQTFIPDNVVILKGVGPVGEPFGDIVTTPSLRNGGIDNATGGKFTIFKEEIGPEHPTQRVIVGAGFYGLPRIYHPSWLIIATVG